MIELEGGSGGRYGGEAVGYERYCRVGIRVCMCGHGGEVGREREGRKKMNAPTKTFNTMFFAAISAEVPISPSAT